MPSAGVSETSAVIVRRRLCRRAARPRGFSGMCRVSGPAGALRLVAAPTVRVRLPVLRRRTRTVEPVTGTRRLTRIARPCWRAVKARSVGGACPAVPPAAGRRRCRAGSAAGRRRPRRAVVASGRWGGSAVGGHVGGAPARFAAVTSRRSVIWLQSGSAARRSGMFEKTWMPSLSVSASCGAVGRPTRLHEAAARRRGVVEVALRLRALSGSRR